MNQKYLSAPSNYFPVSTNPFEFDAGLRKLPKDATDIDDKVFQLDRDWSKYRENILASRKERLDKYVCSSEFRESSQYELVKYLIHQFQLEYPDCFKVVHDKGKLLLDCALSGERLVFDEQLKLIDIESTVDPSYIDGLDALCSQVPEDISFNEILDDTDIVSYLHLCAPNYWAAEDKIGKSFLGAHRNVPGMEKVNRHADKLLTILATKGIYERFTWGLTTDDRLNHHPIPPANWTHEEWYGRTFHIANPSLYFRAERQVMVAFPEINAFLFTIRTYYYDVNHYDKPKLQRLLYSLETMSEEIREYKGLAERYSDIKQYIEERAEASGS